jgi:SAM-dependent methyltransferase
MTSRHLDLGCGNKPRNPYELDEVWGVDINQDVVDSNPFVLGANLTLERIPFESDSFDAVSAYDFLEHVPRVISAADNKSTIFPFIEIMNEIWRVLKNGGMLYAVTPGFPREEAFVDPTHVNPVTILTHNYFSLPHRRADMYGFVGSFKVRRVKWVRPTYTYEPAELSLSQKYRKLRDFIKRRNSHILWELEAVKPEQQL